MIRSSLSIEELDGLFGRARDAMTTEVVTLAPSVWAAEAVTLLTERGVGGAPVVERGHVVGILTLDDLLRLEGSRRAETGPFLRGERRLAGLRVADVMTRSVVTARDDWPLRRAIVVMSEAGINRLPVLDAAGTPVGILTREDVIRRLASVLSSDEREIPTGHASTRAVVAPEEPE